MSCSIARRSGTCPRAWACARRSSRAASAPSPSCRASSPARQRQYAASWGRPTRSHCSTGPGPVRHLRGAGEPRQLGPPGAAGGRRDHVGSVGCERVLRPLAWPPGHRGSELGDARGVGLGDIGCRARSEDEERAGVGGPRGGRLVGDALFDVGQGQGGHAAPQVVEGPDLHQVLLVGAGGAGERDQRRQPAVGRLQVAPQHLGPRAEQVQGAGCLPRLVLGVWVEQASCTWRQPLHRSGPRPRCRPGRAEYERLDTGVAERGQAGGRRLRHLVPACAAHQQEVGVEGPEPDLGEGIVPDLHQARLVGRAQPRRRSPGSDVEPRAFDQDLAVQGRFAEPGAEREGAVTTPRPPRRTARQRAAQRTGHPCARTIPTRSWSSSRAVIACRGEPHRRVRDRCLSGPGSPGAARVRCAPRRGRAECEDLLHPGPRRPRCVRPDHRVDRLQQQLGSADPRLGRRRAVARARAAGRVPSGLPPRAARAGRRPCGPQRPASAAPPGCPGRRASARRSRPSTCATSSPAPSPAFGAPTPPPPARAGSARWRPGADAAQPRRTCRRGRRGDAWSPAHAFRRRARPRPSRPRPRRPAQREAGRPRPRPRARLSRWESGRRGAGTGSPPTARGRTSSGMDRASSSVNSGTPRLSRWMRSWSPRRSQRPASMCSCSLVSFSVRGGRLSSRVASPRTRSTHSSASADSPAEACR